MELVISLIIGGVAGYIISSILHHKQPVGALRIDRSDPTEQPYLFLELTASPDILSKSKYVVLDVKNVNFISHE